MIAGMTKIQIELYEEATALFHKVETKPWLAQGMLDHGYDDDAWAVGHALFDTACATSHTRADASATQLGATDTVNQRFEQDWPHFLLSMQTCVSLLKGQTEWLRLLGLHSARLDGNGTSQITKPEKDDNVGQTLNWLDNFYNVAQTHPEISAILAKNNFPPARLARDGGRVADLHQATHHQAEAIAAQKQAVKDRNAAWRTFKPWLRRAQATADIVEKEHEAQKTPSVSTER